jgi:hypothetical protein
MIRLLAAVGTAAVLILAAPTAAFAFGGDHSLARGTVSEVVSGGDWHISFDIQARDRGWNSGVTVRNPVETFSFTGALCTGAYHDPVHGGTSVYIVGPRTWYHGSGADNEPFYAFKVHQSGPFSADYSWVDVGLTSANAARGACANPAATLSAAYFPLDSSHVSFDLRRHH